MRATRRIGPWSLIEKLGSGGNADVWRATDANGREVALKVLHTARAGREPYRRFVREIQTLQNLPDLRGILPLIDAHLPEHPSEADRPWLAMPIATLIPDALSGQPLEVVIAAVASIASTLARIHDEYGLGHRDVKPNNLYSLKGEWLVGDFGLVAVPDLEELTRTGRPLGPAHFTPYEMIASPTTVDPKPVDVYSLAKTLWVLATELRFPPEGHQRTDTRGFAIADFRPHPNSHALDVVIDRCTQIHPEDRPTMAEVAADLDSWLTLPPEAQTVDIGEVRARLRTKMATRLAEEDQAAERKELALDAVRRLAELVAPLNRALLDLHPRAAIDGSADEFTRNVVRTLDEVSGSPEIAFRYQRLSSITIGGSGLGYHLRFGRTLELTDVGNLILHLFIDVGRNTLGGHAFDWMPQAWSAQVGSVQAEEMLRVAVAEAAVQLQAAAGTFVDGIPEGDS